MLQIQCWRRIVRIQPRQEHQAFSCHPWQWRSPAHRWSLKLNGSRRERRGRRFDDLDMDVDKRFWCPRRRTGWSCSTRGIDLIPELTNLLYRYLSCRLNGTAARNVRKQRRICFIVRGWESMCVDRSNEDCVSYSKFESKVLKIVRVRIIILGSLADAIEYSTSVDTKLNRHFSGRSFHAWKSS